MKKLKICVHLHWLFKENASFVERYRSARDAGFDVVECGDIADVPLEDVVAAKNNAHVTHVLMNAWQGEYVVICWCLFSGFILRHFSVFVQPLTSSTLLQLFAMLDKINYRSFFKDLRFV